MSLISSLTASPELLNILLSLVIIPAIGWLLRTLFKDKADKASQVFKDGVKLAYNVVSEISIRTPNKVDDKVAAGLKVLADYYKTEGLKLSPVDEAKAKLVFQAMHGAELKAGK